MWFSLDSYFNVLACIFNAPAVEEALFVFSPSFFFSRVPRHDDRATRCFEQLCRQRACSSTLMFPLSHKLTIKANTKFLKSEFPIESLARFFSFVCVPLPPDHSAPVDDDRAKILKEQITIVLRARLSFSFPEFCSFAR